jgi:hypothetical protein
MTYKMTRTDKKTGNSVVMRVGTEAECRETAESLTAEYGRLHGDRTLHDLSYTVEKVPTYQQRIRAENPDHADEAAAMMDAFLDDNPDCAF